jgi:pimeloyl-ACP methyl ester carboxylesterase
MKRRDEASRTGFVPRTRPPIAVLLALLSAGMFSARQLRGVEVRYEPIVIVSQWGPPTVRAERGRFRVPEDRASGSRSIELAFARIPSSSRSPGSPILWLSGGPGDSGIADLNTPALRLFLELRQLGDVILLDQRGTGESVPRLDCPGNFRFPADLPIDRAAARAQIEEVGRSCAEHWRSAGVNLSAYNTRESAEDVEALRIALGVPKLRVLAGSYGTHLALAALRAHETSFERVVLLGVVGPDHLRRSPADSDEQIARIARLASAGPAFDTRVADLPDMIRRVRDRLTAHPAAVEIDAENGGTSRIVVGAFDLEWYTRSLLTTRAAIAHLPALFQAMEDGDFTELGKISAAWRTARMPNATIFAQRCASAGSRERELRIARERASAALGDAADFAEESVCRAWGVSSLPDGFRDAVRSAVPALFVSGTLDGDAPETNAAEVVRGFPNGVRLQVEGAAHALLGFDDDRTREAVLRFLDGGKLRKTRVSLPLLAFEPSGIRRDGPMLAAATARENPFGGGR